MDYIEKDDKKSCSCNCGCGGNKSTEKSDLEYRLERWAWLINNWDNMSYKEKFSLFIPIQTLIYPPTQISWDKIDSYFTEKTLDIVYDSCRSIINIKFSESNATPGWTVILGPIDIDMIPDAELYAKVKAWYNDNIKNEYNKQCKCKCEEQESTESGNCNKVYKY